MTPGSDTWADQVACDVCDGDACAVCGGTGLVPAWLYQCQH